MVYIQYLLVLFIAYMAGKLVNKLGFPPVIGWVISAIIIGPNVINLLPYTTMQTKWFFYIDTIVKAFVGILVGQGLVWASIKRSGKQLFVIEIIKSICIYGLIAVIFVVIFNRMDIPVVLALVLASIATVVAPGPTIGVITECGAEGPLSEITALSIPINQVVNLIIFYISLSVAQTVLLGGGGSILSQMVISLFAPIGLGVVMGLVAGFIIPKKLETNIKMPLFCVSVIITAFLCAWVGKTFFDIAALDSFFVGLVFTGVFVNIHSQEEVKSYDPLYNMALMVLLVNVAARLDPVSFLGALPLVFAYIIARILGTYFGSKFGGKLSGAPETVQKYLGFTLLPHIGVSLSRAAIAFENLSPTFEEYGALILLVISGASLINEFFALFMSTKAYEWAEELPKKSCHTN